ncbi:MAG: dockerin type I domain-containing protein [Minisyncoccia bacterium]|jgi:hypothetical protein
MEMKRELTYGFLLLATLSVVFLAVGISFAQTSQPVCTADHCDSNIVTVTTQATSTVGTGTVYVIARVGGTQLGSNQNGSCKVDVLPGYANTDCVNIISNAPVGDYSVAWVGGFPSVSNVDATKNPTITVSTQTLSGGSSITFYIDFASTFTPYSVGCAAKDSSSIKVFWSGDVPTAKTVELYGSNSHIIPTVLSTLGSVLPVTIPGNTSYAYIDGGLASGAHRSYAMKTTDSSNNATWSNVVDCTPTATTTPFQDPPTNLEVKSVDRNTLNVTWTDKVTTNRSHHFEVQRIKATPITPTDFAGRGRTSAVVGLLWNDATGYVTYNSVLERSTSADPSTRFSKSDASMTSLPSNEYDPYTDGDKDGSPKTITFYYTNTGLTEATVYYYRLKTCFPDAVTSLYTPAKAGETVNPKPDMACSGYVPGGTSALATTTLTIPPSNLTATTISTSGITVTWKDNSAKEEGFYIYRNGMLAATMGPSAATGATLTYNDTGLSSGTSYTYTVKSFFTDPLTGAKLPSFPSNSATAITWVTLTVSNSPTSGGSISATGINCGNGGTSCSNYFEKGYQVMLTANKATSYDFTNWTGGVCNNSTYPLCSFLINSDITVTANFTYVPPAPVDLCPNVTGVQTTTPCADVICTTSGGTWNVSTQTCTPAPTDLCPNVNGIQTTTPCANTLCVAPATWNISTQSCVTPAPTPLGDYSGDANGDGQITCADVNLINQFVASGGTTLTPQQQKWADYSGNGAVTAYDAALLQQSYNLHCSGASATPTDMVTANLSGAAAVSANSSGNWYANIYDVAKDTVSGWWSGLVSTFKSGWNAIAGLFNGIGVNRAEAVTDVVYNNYFGLNKLSADISSRLLDTGLTENSVYIYRVRVVYDDGGTPATSDWSVDSSGAPSRVAGKTLGTVATVTLCPDGTTPPCPNDGGAPVIYSGLTASGVIGHAFSYNILANNNPTSYGASGLPGDLGVNASTGAITGLSQAIGVSNVTISASNAKGTGSATLRITILGSTGSGCPGGVCGGGSGGVGGMCAGNNLCDKSIPNTQITDGTGALLEQSEVQCHVNADCADVGRYSKTFQEQ